MIVADATNSITPIALKMIEKVQKRLFLCRTWSFLDFDSWSIRNSLDPREGSSSVKISCIPAADSTLGKLVGMLRAIDELAWIFFGSKLIKYL
jgi:hypothetical protein